MLTLTQNMSMFSLKPGTTLQDLSHSESHTQQN